MLLLALPIQAQNMKQLLFQHLDDFFAEEPEVEINLSGTLLRIASRASSDDEDTRRMLQNLKGVYVRTYSLRRINRTDVMDKVEEITSRLEDNDWEVMAKARENAKFSEILIYPLGNDLIGGMVVLALDADDEEFTAVHLEGNIDPDDLSALGNRFGVDALHNLRGNEFVELPCRGEDRYTEACMRQAEAQQLQQDARRLQEELHRNEAQQQRLVREGVAQEQEQLRQQIRQMQQSARQKQQEAHRLFDAGAPRNRDTIPPPPPSPPANNNDGQRRNGDGK